MNNTEKKLHRHEGPEAIVRLESLRVILQKVQNWKTPDHDGMHRFWFKKSTSIHDRLDLKLSSCLKEANITK